MHIKALCVCVCVFSTGDRRGLLRAVIDLTKPQDHFYSHFHIHVTSAFLVLRPQQYYVLLYHPPATADMSQPWHMDKQEDSDLQMST